MDSSISNQLKFLVNENVGVKLESILEKIFQSEIYFFSDILNNRNVQAVNFFIKIILYKIILCNKFNKSNILITKSLIFQMNQINFSTH